MSEVQTNTDFCQVLCIQGLSLLLLVLVQVVGLLYDGDEIIDVTLLREDGQHLHTIPSRVYEVSSVTLVSLAKDNLLPAVQPAFAY